MFGRSTRPDLFGTLLPGTVVLAPCWLLIREFVGFTTVGSDLPLSDHAPNLWLIVQALPLLAAVPLAGMAMAAAVGVTGSILARIIGGPMCRRQLTDAALLAALAVPGLLPHMRALDFLPALLLAGTIAVRRRDRPSLRSGTLIMLGIVLAATRSEFLTIASALPMLAATVLVARPFLASPANDNGLPLNPLSIYPS
jgi:hypothetical protein